MDNQAPPPQPRGMDGDKKLSDEAAIQAFPPLLLLSSLAGLFTPACFYSGLAFSLVVLLFLLVTPFLHTRGCRLAPSLSGPPSIGRLFIGQSGEG